MDQPEKSTRRNFLLTSSGAAAGALLVPSITSAAKKRKPLQQSGLLSGQPVALRHKEIPGFLSAEQLAPHFSAHYSGALRGYLAADKTIQAGLASDKNFNAPAYGALQRARAHKANSVLLHELYFGGMSLEKVSVKSKVLSGIKKRFGSYEKWAEDFQATAKSAAGWAMLSYHSLNHKLYNVACDTHANGPLWMTTPLLVIDMYEHAYYLDYQNNKSEYISKFMQHIDWSVINRRCVAAARG